MLEELDRAIATLQALASAPARIAAAAAPQIAAVARGQWERGQGPDGAAWPPNRDGSVPLLPLTGQIEFYAEGTTIVATGPDELVYHERRRPVFPQGDTLPDAWAAALEAAARKEIGDG